MADNTGKKITVLKKISYILSFIIVFSAVIIIFNIKTTPGIQVSSSEKSAVLIKADMLYSVIEDGDIICRLGDRLWSNLIKDVSVTDKRFSHMGIIRINDGRITVINAEGDTGHGRDYVNEISIGEFLEPAAAAGIYRINNIDGKILSELASLYLGVPFDWQFDMNDSSKLYCTELLYVICNQIGLELNSIYIKELKTSAIPLEAISSSDKFSEVFYIPAKK